MILYLKKQGQENMLKNIDICHSREIYLTNKEND